MQDLDGHESIPETEASLSAAKAVSTFELVIISYGHAKGPLTLADPGPVERLTFSVRDIKNPPARLRRTHTGLSSHLRREVMANQAAAARLSFIVETVQRKMGEMERAREGVDTGAESPLSSATPSTLVVGIMCERGKHRSVSFAEELSRNIRPGDCWVVSVQHRELDPAVQEENSLTSGDGRAGHKPRKRRDLDRKKGRSSTRGFLQDDVPDAEEDV